MNDEDLLISVLAATFRGTNDEVENATKELNLFFTNPNFPNLLFSIIKNKSYDIAIRQSASIQIIRIIKSKLISSDSILPFCQEFTTVIESCEKKLSSLLKKCSYYLISFLYDHSIEFSSMIFDLLSQNHFKSSLFYANSLMKMISNSGRKSIEMFKSFTSNYILVLHEVFLSIFNSENSIEKESKSEIISLIFHFLARSTSYLQPEIFNDYSQIQFWFPLSMETFKAIDYDEHKYLKFLSNWPKREFQTKTDSELYELIKELITWLCNRLNKYEEEREKEGFDLRCISKSLHIFYRLIDFNLFQIDENLFSEILKSFILPSFNSDNLIEYNHPITKKCWNNLYDSSLYLFIKILEKDNQFSNIFYSLFENSDFIESDYFISALDLYSLCTDLFYKINSDHFFSFLYQLGSLIESENNQNNIKIVCLKIFSKINKIELNSDFLLKSIYFSFANLFDEDSLVRYFAALSASSLISQIHKNNEKLKFQIFESTPIIEKMNDLFVIFFELERDYQTQMITESLMKIIFFFGEKIQPFLLQISNEVIEFFFNFSSNSENREPSNLLTPILCKLIEIAKGDDQFTMFVLTSLLNEEKLSNICYPRAFDNLFEIFTTLIYYSNEFLEDFCQIIPFLNAYLCDKNEDEHLFADFSNVVDMLIWKKSMTNESEIEKIDSILTEFLLQFLHSCDYFDEWIVAASSSIKINSFSNSYEISFILPKLLTFLSSNQFYISNDFVYDVIEHAFSFHSKSIFSSFSEEVNFLFNDIYIQYAKYPSFIDSLLKCFNSLPNEFKTIAYQKAKLLVENKNKSIEISNEEEEEEEWNEVVDDEAVPTPKWFDEIEILKNFESFVSQIESSE